MLGSVQEYIYMYMPDNVDHNELSVHGVGEKHQFTRSQYSPVYWIPWRPHGH